MLQIEGKNCALHFVIVFLVPVLFMGMDCLLNACLLIMFKWPMPAEKVLNVSLSFAEWWEAQLIFWDSCLYFGLQPLQQVLTLSVLLRKVFWESMGFLPVRFPELLFQELGRLEIKATSNELARLPAWYEIGYRRKKVMEVSLWFCLNACLCLALPVPQWGTRIGSCNIVEWCPPLCWLGSGDIKLQFPASLIKDRFFSLILLHVLLLTSPDYFQ